MNGRLENARTSISIKEEMREIRGSGCVKGMCLVSSIYGDDRGLLRLRDWGVYRVPCVCGSRPTAMTLRNVNLKARDCELDTDLELLRGDAVVLPRHYDKTCTIERLVDILTRAQVGAVLFVDDSRNYERVSVKTQEVTLVSLTMKQYHHVLRVYNTLLMGNANVKLNLETPAQSKTLTYSLDVTSGPSFLVRCVDSNDWNHDYYAAVEGIPLYDIDPKHVRIRIPNAYFGLIWRIYDSKVKISRGVRSRVEVCKCRSTHTRVLNTHRYLLRKHWVRWVSSVLQSHKKIRSRFYNLPIVFP